MNVLLSAAPRLCQQKPNQIMFLKEERRRSIHKAMTQKQPTRNSLSPYVAFSTSILIYKKEKEKFQVMHVRSNTRKVSDSRKVFRHAPKFQNQAKFQAHADPRQNFIDPRNPHDPRKFSTHFTRAPPYPRTNATHAIQQTLKNCINLYISDPF